MIEKILDAIFYILDDTEKAKQIKIWIGLLLLLALIITAAYLLLNIPHVIEKSTSTH